MHFSPEPAFQNSNICYRYRFRCHQFCPCWCLPESIVTDIPHELLMYFTSKTDDTYVINSRIREMVTFANHNFIKDPPFSKLDVVSCRNLLIYLEPVLQKKPIPLFHYILNPEGFLALGNSETVGEFTHLFSAVDEKCKIFQAGILERYGFLIPPVHISYEMRHGIALLMVWKNLLFQV